VNAAFGILIARRATSRRREIAIPYSIKYRPAQFSCAAEFASAASAASHSHSALLNLLPLRRRLRLQALDRVQDAVPSLGAGHVALV
jgi:hypothetical protein